mgnify:CR=1 FL=1
MTSCAHTRRGLLLALPGLCLLNAAKAHAQQAEHQTFGGSETDQTLVTYELDSWVDAWGRPTAKVMINGRGPFNFMVDTGSTTSVIANRHLERIGAPDKQLITLHESGHCITVDRQWEYVAERTYDFIVGHGG